MLSETTHFAKLTPSTSRFLSLDVLFYSFIFLLACPDLTTSTTKDDSYLSRPAHRRPNKTRSASQIVQHRLSCGEFLLSGSNGYPVNSSFNGKDQAGDSVPGICLAKHLPVFIYSQHYG